MANTSTPAVVERSLLEPGIALLTVNRPEARNALNREVLDGLSEALSTLAQDDQVRALVLTGSGEKAFASGADIAELRERTHREAFFTVTASAFQKLEDFPRPTIAAIEGYALGGGLELALACDLRVASKRCKLGLPEVSLGISPAAGGTWRLPRLVGLGRARELIFTGRIVEAEEALSLGQRSGCASRARRCGPRRSWRAPSPSTRRWRCRWPSCPSTPPPGRWTPARSRSWGRPCSTTRPRSASG